MTREQMINDIVNYPYVEIFRQAIYTELPVSAIEGAQLGRRGLCLDASSLGGLSLSALQLVHRILEVQPREGACCAYGATPGLAVWAFKGGEWERVSPTVYTVSALKAELDAYRAANPESYEHSTELPRGGRP